MERLPAGDTDPTVEARRLELFRRMSPARKLQLVEDANRTARELALAGIAARRPETTEAERTRLLLGLVLGEDAARELYGPPPDPPGSP